MVPTPRPLYTEERAPYTTALPHLASTIIPFSPSKHKRRGRKVLDCVCTCSRRRVWAIPAHDAFLLPCGGPRGPVVGVPGEGAAAREQRMDKEEPERMKTRRFLAVLLAVAMVLAGSVKALAENAYDADDVVTMSDTAEDNWTDVYEPPVGTVYERDVEILNGIIQNNWVGDDRPREGTVSSIPEEWVHFVKWENIDGTNHITEIDLWQYDIYGRDNTLKGALNLTELTYLERVNIPNYSGNSIGLTSVDVSDLKYLYLLSCGADTLADLNLTGCTGLKILDCGSYVIGQGGFGAHCMTRIDLSGAPNLEWLCLSGGNLTSINLSHTPNLKELYIGSNQLTELNLADTPGLTSLSCADNPIETLELSVVPKLEMLDCSYNKLTSLDLSGNDNMYLLDCFNNELESLKLSPKARCRYLDCTYNNLMGKGSITGLDWDALEKGTYYPGDNYFHKFLPQNDGVDPGDLPEGYEDFVATSRPSATTTTTEEDPKLAKDDVIESNRRAEEAAMEVVKAAMEAISEGKTPAKVQNATTAAGATVPSVSVNMYGMSARISVDGMKTMADASVSLRVNLDGGAAEVLIPGGFPLPDNPGVLYYTVGFQQDPLYSNLMRAGVKEVDARTEVYRLGGGELPTTVTVTLKTKLKGPVNIYRWNEDTRRATLLATAAAEGGKVTFATKQLGNLIVTTGTI